MIYIIPTPLGNLKDLTIRGKELLLELNCLVVENYQTTNHLLNNIGKERKTKLISFVKNDNFNKREIEQAIRDHQDIGVCSEAGMPSVSDPGYLLIEYLQNNKIPYSALPGCCSVDTAVAASGLVTKGYVFLGFVPTKKGRKSYWEEANSYNLPIVIFESVHRIQKCLEDITKYFDADDQVFIAREMTKIFEEYIYVNVKDLKDLTITEKGEFVIVVRKGVRDKKITPNYVSS